MSVKETPWPRNWAGSTNFCQLPTRFFFKGLTKKIESQQRRATLPCGSAAKVPDHSRAKTLAARREVKNRIVWAPRFAQMCKIMENILLINDNRWSRWLLLFTLLKNGHFRLGKIHRRRRPILVTAERVMQITFEPSNPRLLGVWRFSLCSNEFLRNPLRFEGERHQYRENGSWLKKFVRNRWKITENRLEFLIRKQRLGILEMRYESGRERPWLSKHYSGACAGDGGISQRKSG
jgi:hypothetical protein